MTELGEKQRHAERQRAAEAEQVREGADKALPVAGHQKNPEPQRDRHAVAQQAWPIARQPRPDTVEKGIRTPKRNTEEQVLMQEHLPQPMTCRRCLVGITGALFRVARGDQVMAAQKAQQFINFGFAQWQARLAIGGLQHA